MTSRYAHLLALVMLVASGPAFAQTYTDYDTDDDNLIDITTIAQLQGIRWDHDGNGFIRSDLQATDGVNYNAAFPNRQTAPSLESTLPRMGCPGVCLGYELMNDLDFATAASNLRTWGQGYNYEGILEGNGYTISNLNVSALASSGGGLFRRLIGTVRNLGLINPTILGRTLVGTLAAENNGTISACYAVGGSVGILLGGVRTGVDVGGLVGSNYGTIIASYANVSVSGNSQGINPCSAGGLVGQIATSGQLIGSITASYAYGNVTCTSTGPVRVGGLVAVVEGSATTVTNSYCDTETTGLSTCIRLLDRGATSANAPNNPKTTAEMQTPTGYTGIYADWNVDVDGDNVPDNPWNFGTSSQYPTLYPPIGQIRVSISSESVAEGATGTTPLRFTVSLSSASGAQVTVAYADAGTGSAESGTDYTALAGGMLTFAAGATSKTITISVIGDAAIEPDETVVVTLSNPVNATLDVATATGTITDDDRPPNTDPTFGESVGPQSYYRDKAIDPLTLPAATDGNGTITYSLTELPEGLTFDAETRELSGTPTKVVEKALYTLTATDEDGDEGTMSFFLTIVSNLLPSFGDANVAAQAYLRKQEIESLTLPQATGGDEPLTYALTPALPDGLSFDTETRIVSGTPLEAIAETTYTLTATDSDGDEATLMFTIVVTTDPVPTFGDTTIAAQGLQHQEIKSMTLPQATGGDEPLTYALFPALPEGLSFNVETRIVSGTPLEAMDETTYTLTATDGNGDEARLMFTLEVPDLAPAFGDTTIAAQGYLVNQEIASLTFPQATSGDGMLVYILLPFLPEGLNFDPTTRMLSGMPTEAKAQATYTLSALDADGDTASLPFTLEVSRNQPDVQPGHRQARYPSRSRYHSPRPTSMAMAM